MGKLMYIQAFLAGLAIFMPFIKPRYTALMHITGLYRSSKSFEHPWRNHNTETCEVHYPEMLTGCEDMSLFESADGKVRTLYLACSPDMESKIDWFPPLGIKKNPHVKQFDKIYAWDLIEDAVTELEVDTYLQTEDQGNRFEFVSHGIDVVPSFSHNDQVSIYAINHLPSGSVVDKFTHKISTNKATHVKRFNDQSIIHTPNDLYVSSEEEDEFYITNDHAYPTGFKRLAETMLQLPTTHFAVHSNLLPGTGYRMSKDWLPALNGITGNRKGLFFVNSVASAHTYVYKYNPGRAHLVHEEDGNVTYVDSITYRFSSDNPSYNSHTQELLLAGFANVLPIEDFAAHAGKVSRMNSIVGRIPVDRLEESTYKKATSAEEVTERGVWEVEEFFLDIGAVDHNGVTPVMNMSTTAVVDAKNDRWYMTSCFGYGIVRCEGYSKTKSLSQ